MTIQKESSLTAIKRDGTRVPFNIDKIKKVIAWACEGLNVNPIKLESGITTLFTDGVTTRAIQENTIQEAVKLTSIEEPHWKDVAGRLMMMNVWKETKLSRGFGYEYGASAQAILDKIEDGEYSNILKVYSEGDIYEAVSWIIPELDLNYDFAGMSVLANPNPNKRYLFANELLQEAYVVQSLMLASVEKADERLKWAKEFYYWLSEKKISLATPFWINLRKPNGSLSSCFTLETDDDTDSIFNAIHKIANISAAGGGVGILVSKIRARGSWVRGKKKASNGVIPFIKIINDTAVAIDQGSSRAGAVTVALDSWHLDIEEFLEIQLETGGDIRGKSFDIFPQVVCSDEFMRRVDRGQEWTLVDPYEVKIKYGKDLVELWGKDFESVYKDIESNLDEIGGGNTPNLKSSKITLWKKVNAKDIYKKMMKTKIETGLPYEMFKDTVNKYNPNKQDGSIKLLNLCIESMSNTSDLYNHVCSLVSLNLANLCIDEVESVTNTAVRLLNNAIDLTVTPTKETQAHNERYRVIGIGYMGLHDYLAKNNLNYFTGKKEAAKLAERIAYYSFKASIELGKERGNFEAFEGSELNKGYPLGKLFYGKQYILVDELRKVFTEDELDKIKKSDSLLKNLFSKVEPYDFEVYDCDLDWGYIRENIQHYSINSQLIAVAPNTTTALIQGCTASVLPTFSKFFIDKTSKGTMVNCPPYLTDKFWYYTENKNLDQQVVIDMCAELQRFIDTGVSMELLFNLNNDEVDARYIYERQLSAWEQGCKGIYYLRSIDSQKNIDEGCSSCAS